MEAHTPDTKPEPRQAPREDLANPAEAHRKHPEFLTPAEFASQARISRVTVYRLLARGLIRALPGLRIKRIPASELERWSREATK
jgi:excisionase family DNA binding protein